MKNRFQPKPIGLFQAILIIFAMLAAQIAIPPAGVSAEDANPWVAASALRSARAAFPAILLNNGKVLVAGGINSSGGVTNSADLYNPSTGTWTATGNMKVARFGYAALLMADGKVLAVGGSNGSSGLSGAEIYNPTAGTWANTGSLPVALAYPVAALLTNGKVLVAGGMVAGTSGTNTAYLYDPATGTFTPTGSMNTGRFYHTATRLQDGRILLAGGTTNGSNSLASIEIYDPATGTWASAGSLSSMSHARHTQTATLLTSGDVLIAGGTPDMNTALNSAELFAPSSGTWTDTGAMVSGRYFHTATLLGDGTVLVTGGSDNDNMLASAELYTPNADGGTWSAIGTAMSYPKINHSAVAINSYQVLVAGGITGDQNNQTVITACQIYDHRPSATITLGDLNQTYSGDPKPVSVTTVPAGLEGSVSVTYTGVTSTVYGPTTTPPTAPGTYSLDAKLDTSSYRGSVTGTLVVAKATATVTLSGLNQTYSGSQRPVTATTVPSGLSVTFSYSGTSGTTYGPSATPPTNAGTYSVTATVDDAYYQGTTTGTLVVASASATVTLSSLSQTYNGNPRAVTTSTSPGGLGVTVTYTGNSGTTYGPSTTAPSDAGTYGVTASISDPNYQGTATGTLTVAKATATVYLSGLSRTYDGTPKSVPVTTNPTGLYFTLSYVGITPTVYGPSASAPTNAGTYSVNAIIDEPNYEGAGTGELTINRANSSITIGNLNQAYDGTPRAVSATTNPAGAAVAFTYAGIDGTHYELSAVPPIDAGTYSVTSTIDDPNYLASSASDTLIVSKANAAITFSGLSQSYDGNPKAVTVTTIPAGLPVTLVYTGISDGAYGPTASAPTSVGLYRVTATIDHQNYQGVMTETLAIVSAGTQDRGLYLPMVIR